MLSPKRKLGPNKMDELQDQNGQVKETLLVEKALRSGQRVSSSGHVVVLGDVHAGAEIVAGGNIIVMGSLQGLAHAGALGDSNAVIVAFRLAPTQLRIAEHITRAPDGPVTGPGGPEIARIKGGVVTVERFG